MNETTDRDRKLWNPEIETLSRDALAALQLERLQKQVAYNYENSEFFTEKIYKKYSATIAKHPDVKNELEKILKNIGNKRDNNLYAEYHHAIMSINKEISESPFNNEVHAKLAMTHYDFGFIKEALDKAVQIVNSEGTLTGYGYGALMEILKDLGPESNYVKDFQPTLQKLHMKYRDKNTLENN